MLGLSLWEGRLPGQKTIENEDKGSHCSYRPESNFGTMDTVAFDALPRASPTRLFACGCLIGTLRDLSYYSDRSDAMITSPTPPRAFDHPIHDM